MSVKEKLGKILVLGAGPCGDSSPCPTLVEKQGPGSPSAWSPWLPWPWRNGDALASSPQCEDAVSKGAQQKQMKDLLSPRPQMGPSGSPELCEFHRNQDFSLAYFTPQVLHLAQFKFMFTARVRRPLAAPAFRLARGEGCLVSSAVLSVCEVLG